MKPLSVMISVTDCFYLFKDCLPGIIMIPVTARFCLSGGYTSKQRLFYISKPTAKPKNIQDNENQVLLKPLVLNTILIKL